MYINLRIKVPAIVEIICLWLILRYRKKHYGFAFRRIKLIGGNYAIVDPDDYPKLSQCDWMLKESRNTSYAWRMTFKEDGKLKIIYMYREIMQAKAGSIIDHQNRNGLDNRKANLKFTDRRQNALNCTKKARRGQSKYKGVCKDEKRGKWRAYIHTNTLKPKHLGYFDSEEEAAKVYDEAVESSRRAGEPFGLTQGRHIKIQK